MAHKIFEKLNTLRNQLPYLPYNFRTYKGQENMNCDYCDEIGLSADAFLCFTCTEISRSAYCSYIVSGNECLDCDLGKEMQLCYACTGFSEKCHGCAYCNTCKNCFNCHFCDNCFNCTDCFGCVEIESKKFCIFNKQYTETEYRQKLGELLKDLPEKNRAKVAELRRQIPLVNLVEFENENSELCVFSFFNNRCSDLIYSRENEDCVHLFEGSKCKFCSDGNLIYQCQMTDETTNCDSVTHSAFMIDCSRTHFSYFCNYCVDCSHCFGCVGLEFKEYYIFNKPYKEEEYHTRVAQLLQELNESKLDLANEWYRIWSLEVAEKKPRAIAETKPKREESKPPTRERAKKPTLKSKQ